MRGQAQHTTLSASRLGFETPASAPAATDHRPPSHQPPAATMAASEHAIVGGQVIAVDRTPDVLLRPQGGADPNDPAEFKDGISPLYHTAACGRTDIVDELCAAGAEVGWANPADGCTALHVATSNRHCRVIQALAWRGADPNALALQRRTPLHLAALNPSGEVTVKSLVALGVDVSIRDACWKIPTQTGYLIKNGRHRWTGGWTPAEIAEAKSKAAKQQHHRFAHFLRAIEGRMVASQADVLSQLVSPIEDVVTAIAQRCATAD